MGLTRRGRRTSIELTDSQRDLAVPFPSIVRVVLPFEVIYTCYHRVGHREEARREVWCISIPSCSNSIGGGPNYRYPCPQYGTTGDRCWLRHVVILVRSLVVAPRITQHLGQSLMSRAAQPRVSCKLLAPPVTVGNYDACPPEGDIRWTLAQEGDRLTRARRAKGVY